MVARVVKQRGSKKAGPNLGPNRSYNNRQKELRNWLESEIVEGRLAPGDKLDEQEICRRFGVSRTPMREALLQLASIGLVVFRRRQGTIVTRMSMKQIVSMWEVLTCLEGLCAALAARRMTLPERAELRSVCEESEPLVVAGNVPAYDEANTVFHSLIYAGCRNEYLATEVKEIRSRTRVYRRSSFHRSGRLTNSFAGHQGIMEAICKGDDVLAERLMQEHITSSLSVLDLVAEIPEYQ
ncbi:MAG: GntR family transcriptional regulator [Rhodospirillaceae bacterium]